MGSWGLTNLQNDIAEDVKSDYISLLQSNLLVQNYQAWLSPYVRTRRHEEYG